MKLDGVQKNMKEQDNRSWVNYLTGGLIGSDGREKPNEKKPEKFHKTLGWVTHEEAEEFDKTLKDIDAGKLYSPGIIGRIKGLCGAVNNKASPPLLHKERVVGLIRLLPVWVKDSVVLYLPWSWLQTIFYGVVPQR